MKKKISVKKLTSLVLTLLMSLSVVACGNSKTVSESTAKESKYKTIKNVDGTKIKVPTKVKRIGAIFGPAYEKVVMLGAEDKIVYDGDFHKTGWPWSNVIYKRINKVHGIPNAHTELNIEDLMKYNADVVFNFPNPKTTASMEAAGISVVPSSGTGKFSDLKETVKVYAEAIGGNAINISNEYSTYFDSVVKKISSRTKDIPDKQKPKVYFANQEILWANGSKSDINEVIGLAGGISVSKDVAGGSKTEITKEQLIKWNPNYIFIDHAGSSGNATAEEVIKKMVADKDYAKLNAVVNKNVYIVPTGVFFWDSGVQKPLLLMLMAKTLHPDKFADIDMNKEVKEFYSKFFNYNLTNDEVKRILAHENPITK